MEYFSFMSNFYYTRVSLKHARLTIYIVHINCMKNPLSKSCSTLEESLMKKKNNNHCIYPALYLYIYFERERAYNREKKLDFFSPVAVCERFVIVYRENIYKFAVLCKYCYVFIYLVYKWTAKVSLSFIYLFLSFFFKYIYI